MIQKMLGLCCVMLVMVGQVMAQNTAFTVGSWNVESGGANPDTLANQLADFDEVDLWGFVEVGSDADAELFEIGAETARGAEFSRIVSESGDEDRLAIVYNSERFELIDSDELDYINPTGRLRSPLVAMLKDTVTGQEFAFMVNHLKSKTDPDSRRERNEQSTLLNEWARDAAEYGLPVIAVGDYNYYYETDGSRYEQGLDLLTAEDVFEWVVPEELVLTQCTVDGNRCVFNSVVDFIFVSGQAQTWNGTSVIVVRDGDLPDDEQTSDHRPVLARFEIPN